MEDSIQTILNYNEPKYNYLALASELAELQDLVIKKYLKQETHKPSLERITEEIAHVLLRFKIIARMEHIQIRVNEEMHKKSLQLVAYVKEKKYKGGV